MIKTTSAKLDAGPHRFALVVSRFNEFISSRLCDGAVDALVRHGAKESSISKVWVPGAFELPVAVQKIARTGAADAVIALGCVIRGETPHFDFVAGEAAKGCAQVALETGVPVLFGIITADTLEQAVARAGGKQGNKGADAALAAIEMANLLVSLSESK